jgi:hypothetical protein
MNRRAGIVTQPCLFDEGRDRRSIVDIVASFVVVEKENLWNLRIVELEVAAIGFPSS